MQVAQVDFCWQEDTSNPEQEALNQEISSNIDILISVWRSHGQVAGDAFPCIETPGSLRYWLMLPGADSLAPEHDSKYGRRSRQKLEAKNVRVEVEVLGRDAESMEPCPCLTRGSLILYTNYTSLESPLRCGDCFGPIPLYKIPYQADNRGELHDKIRGWTSDYHSCDRLQMNCTTGERFGLRQMGDMSSSLSRQGQDICRRIKEALGLPVYYYLHRYRARSLASEHERKCPRCDGAWRLPEELHGQFDFRCERCRLLSNIAHTLRD